MWEKLGQLLTRAASLMSKPVQRVVTLTGQPRKPISYVYTSTELNENRQLSPGHGAVEFSVKEARILLENLKNDDEPRIQKLKKQIETQLEKGEVVCVGSTPDPGGQKHRQWQDTLKGTSTTYQNSIIDGSLGESSQFGGKEPEHRIYLGELDDEQMKRVADCLRGYDKLNKGLYSLGGPDKEIPKDLWTPEEKQNHAATGQPPKPPGNCVTFVNEMLQGDTSNTPPRFPQDVAGKIQLFGRFPEGSGSDGPPR